MALEKLYFELIHLKYNKSQVTLQLHMTYKVFIHISESNNSETNSPKCSEWK